MGRSLEVDWLDGWRRTAAFLVACSENASEDKAPRLEMSSRALGRVGGPVGRRSGWMTRSRATNAVLSGEAVERRSPGHLLCTQDTCCPSASTMVEPA